MRNPASKRVRFGPFVVDLHTHEVRRDGTRIKLIGQPFDILALLLNKPGELVTREQLRAALWPGDTFVDFDHGLNAAVNKLREALCDSADNPRFVETLPRRGYRFIALVEGLDIPDVGATTETGGPIASAGSHSIHPNQLKRDVRTWRWEIAIAFGAALLAAFGGLVWRMTGGSHQHEVEARSLSTRIVPFTGAGESAGEPVFSPDGRFVAFLREGTAADESGIFVREIGKEQESQLSRGEHDCCPAWSPDGKTIVFSRRVDRDGSRKHEIYIVPAVGGAERKLNTGGVTPRRGEVDWSGDGKSIAFSSEAGIFLFALETSAARRLTNAPPGAEDWGPAFSTDGTQLLFVRSRGAGFPEEIITVPSQGGQERIVNAALAQVLGPARWSLDGRSVIFSSLLGGKSGLWKVSVESKDAAVQVNDGGAYPAISRQGNFLAYQRETRGLHIWQMDLPVDRDAKESILVPLTSQTDQGPAPQISPDGKKLAYMSDRSGTMEIWVSDGDGKNPVQLSSVGNAGTPRWSPDSRAVVFDADQRKGAAIYTAKLGERAARLLTPDEFDNRCPGWSRDGKWIYFTSARTGRFEVWKVPADGGTPWQLTKNGGHAPLESPDGKYVYYSKTPYAYPEVWQVPARGGEEKLLSRNVRPVTWASWFVTDRGILFATPSGSGGPVVRLYDFSTRRVKTVGSLKVVPFWLGASRDGRTVVFDKPGWTQSQIMLTENFR